MTVYLDILFAVNLISTYFMLLLTKKFLKIKISNLRIILASLLGMLSSLIILLPKISELLNFFISLAIAFAISFAAFFRGKLRMYLYSTAVLFFSTFLYSGIIYFLSLKLGNGKMYVFNNVTYLEISPVTLVIFSVISFLGIRIFDRFAAKRKSEKEVFRISLVKNKISYSFCAVLDTCMSLWEPFSGSPVILCEREILGDFGKGEKGRIVPFESLGGSGILYAYRADRVTINDKLCQKEIFVAVCENVIKGPQRALIGNNIVGGFNA